MRPSVNSDDEVESDRYYVDDDGVLLKFLGYADDGIRFLEVAEEGPGVKTTLPLHLLMDERYTPMHVDNDGEYVQATVVTSETDRVYIFEVDSALWPVRMVDAGEMYPIKELPHHIKLAVEDSTGLEVMTDG